VLDYADFGFEREFFDILIKEGVVDVIEPFTKQNYQLANLHFCLYFNDKKEFEKTYAGRKLEFDGDVNHLNDELCEFDRTLLSFKGDFVSNHLALQVCLSRDTPCIDGNDLNQWFRSEIISHLWLLSRKGEIKKKTSGPPNKFEESLLGLQRVLKFKFPAYPLLVSKGGSRFQSMPVGMRALGFVLDGKEGNALDEEESRRRLDTFLRIRDRSSFREFKAHLLSAQRAANGLDGEAKIAKIQEFHQNSLNHISDDIARDLRGWSKFADITTYVSLPIALGGLVDPIIGLTGLALTGLGFGATAFKDWAAKRRATSEKFLQRHPEHRWHSFLASDLRKLDRD